MQGVHLRKYGVEATIDFELYEVDGVDFRVDAADAGADCSIMKDEGDEATCTNDFVDEGKGYSITLTATEMQAARIVVYIVDSAAKVWLDKSITIETYGHASAQHALDLDTAVATATGLATHDGKLDTVDTIVDAIKVRTDHLPAERVKGTADSGTTTTMVDSARTENTTDYWKESLIRFTSGGINGQTRLITGFTPASDTITFYPALATAVTTHTYEIIPAGFGNVLTDWIDAGRLDAILDTIATAAARLTAVRAAVLTDWINGGRLDLLLDAIPTTAMRGTDSAALASALTTHDGKLDTAQSDLDKLTGTDGATLATAQGNYAPNKVVPDAAGTAAGLHATTDGLLATIAGYIDTEVAAILAALDTEIAAIMAVTDKLDDTLEDDAGVQRFTENALEQAPSGTGGDATAANQTTIITHLTDVKGSGFAGETDALKPIRDKIDTISGGSPVNVQHDSTVISKDSG